MLPTRLRKNKTIRALVRETRLDMDDVICPLFIAEDLTGKRAIKSMPGQYHIGLDSLEDEIKEIADLGIKAVILFGIPNSKDDKGSAAYDDEGIIQKAVMKIRETSPEMFIITDVCLCEYKADGHCCFFTEKGNIDRIKTLEVLSQVALSHVRSGADMLAPSDMMDGHIESIRKTLDENGYEHIPIMGYSAKFNSAFYGPFRDAAKSAPRFGDRKSYQMDPGNRREAQLEIELDLKEGADLVMVKPAMSYLDIISMARSLSDRPVAAYQVSGEYSMLVKAIQEGLFDDKILYESLLSIKRAGADLIITYLAKEVPRLIERFQD